MNIGEAIKELERDITDFGGPGTSPVCQAERLGIEALKVIKGFEDICPVSCHLMLPGETE